MFKITNSKGFHMTFGNGVTVSVQWGPENYCVGTWNQESPDAEIAVWDREGKNIDPEGLLIGETRRHLPKDSPSMGWCSPEDALKIMAAAAGLSEERLRNL